MEVIELVPGERVRWRVVDGPPEWIGTTIDWRLSRNDGYTIVLFTHEGWAEPVEFLYHCSTKWAVYLLSLKALVETGDRVALPGRRGDQRLALSRRSTSTFTPAPRCGRNTGRISLLADCRYVYTLESPPPGLPGRAACPGQPWTQRTMREARGRSPRPAPSSRLHQAGTSSGPAIHSYIDTPILCTRVPARIRRSTSGRADGKRSIG